MNDIYYCIFCGRGLIGEEVAEGTYMFTHDPVPHMEHVPLGQEDDNPQ